MPDHRRAGRPEHARAAGSGQLPARRAGRPALLRQRPQRPALHPRQADEDSSPSTSISTGSAAGPASSRSSPSSATSPPASPTSLFDPDYARNGVFYTLHMEDPNGAGSPAPKPGAVAGLDLTGYTTTPAVPTPTVDGQIEREVVLIEWTDRNPANATFEGTARELLRRAASAAAAPAGRDDLQPGRAARRSRLAGDVPRRRRFRLGRPDATAAASTRSGSTPSSARSCASCPTCASTRRPARSARTAATGFPTTIRSRPSRAPARRSGPTACAIRTG